MAGAHAAVHLLRDNVLKLILQRRILLVHAEKTVNLCFDLLTKFQVIFRVFLELLDICFCEGVLSLAWIHVLALLQIVVQCTGTEWRRDPCGASDEYLELFDNLL